MSKNDLISVSGLYKSYYEQGLVRKKNKKEVLRGISFTIKTGESLGLVGASGCGKSTLCRALLGLEDADRGEVLFNNRNIKSLNKADRREFRRTVQLVFQDSIAAVNPRYRVKDIIGEPLKYLTDLSKEAREERAAELLVRVGLESSYLDKLPGRMSGGQLQRVCIARALSTRPSIIALDESLSSLDALLQNQLIDLLRDIQRKEGSSFLFITHDLRLIHRFCQRVLVLDKGILVEDRQVKADMAFSSAMGLALQNAILPASPIWRSHQRNSRKTACFSGTQQRV